MSNTTASLTLLEREQIWDKQLKEILKAEIGLATGYVKWLSHPDGDTLKIPSIGGLPSRDYQENQDVQFDSLDTGEFNFQITEYKSAATYITDKAKQDTFYLSELQAAFPREMTRAIMEDLEQNILALEAKQIGNSTFNGEEHRLSASYTPTPALANGKHLAVADFAKAKYVLKKSHVPDRSLIAIVPPSQEYALSTLTNLVDVSNNPKWEGIITSGIASGMRFVRNIYGFDVYTSEWLNSGGTDQVEALFFSADPSAMPFIGAWRQQVRVESERNVSKQRDEFVTTCRYGLDLYRPEALVTIKVADKIA